MDQQPSKTVALFFANFVTGGVQWCMLRLARVLKSRGYKVVLVVMSVRGDLYPIAQKEFEIIDIKAARSLCGAGSGVRALGRFIKTYTPDVLISNLKRENLISVLARIVTPVPVKLVLVEHTLSSFDASPVMRQIKIFLERVMLPLFYAHADEVVAVCRAIGDDVERKLGRNGKTVRIIYNPVIPDNFECLVKSRADHKWFRSPQNKVVLAIGRFRHEKGFSVLLDAFKEVHETDAAARLILIGDGPEKENLLRQTGRLGLEDVVDFLGFKDNVFPWMAASTMFVLPSIWDEPFGLVVVEALACGLPVVSTDGGGPKEILEDGRYGRLVPRGDAQALAQEIRHVLARENDPTSAVARGLSFSVQASANDYIKLIESL